MKADRFSRVLVALIVISVLGLPLGDIFNMASQAQGPTAPVCVLYHLGGPQNGLGPPNPLDPNLSSPQGIDLLAEGPDHELYSTSPGGGKFGRGTVYKITRAGKLSILWDFDVITGDGPQGGLTPGGKDEKFDGYFYGTTYGGGARGSYNQGTGTIFRIKPAGGRPEVLYNFKNGGFWEIKNNKIVEMKPPPCPTAPNCPFSPEQWLNVAGSSPISAPVLAGDGNLYGVTAYSNSQGFGVLYRISPAGGEENFKALCIFDSRYLKDPTLAQYVCAPTGSYASSLILGNDGKTLYGTTLGGHGTVFKATLAGKVTTLHEFEGTDGSKPHTVMQGTDGNLYGTTYEGGSSGYGVVYRLSGTDYTVLHDFNVADGANPVAGLVEGIENKKEDRKLASRFAGPPRQQEKEGPLMTSPLKRSDGYLYGATKYGGHGRGVLYRINMTLPKDFQILKNLDPHWTETGRKPTTTPMLHSDGNLYGTTSEGGTYDAGVLYRLNLNSRQAQTGMLEFGLRWCCALGQKPSLGWGGGALDPDSLGHHLYGTKHSALNTYSSAETVGGGATGFVYTDSAGLVDFGHLRDTADMTKYVYDGLISGTKQLRLREGIVNISTIPDDQNSILELAGAIAYVDYWAHELTTWATTSQDLSSFSPEDLPSNMIGIEVGKRAIKNSCRFDLAKGSADDTYQQFNAAVDAELATMMKELKAQPKSVTEGVLKNVEGHLFDAEGNAAARKWFVVTGALLRRNFDGRPWNALDPDRPLAAPSWLKPDVFVPYYGKFLYQIIAEVKYEVNNKQKSEANVRESRMQEVTNLMRGAWVREHGLTDRP